MLSLNMLLEDESVVVRCAATAALVMLGEAPDQVPLARLLFEGAARERAQAAFLLGEIGNDSAVPMLLDAARAPLPRTNIIEEQILRLCMRQTEQPEGWPGLRTTQLAVW